MIERWSLLLIALTVSVVLTVAPAQAQDLRPCVSRAEYRTVLQYRVPAPMGRVHKIFDTKGTISWQQGSGDHRDVYRAYRKCPGWGPGRVFVMYDNYSWYDAIMRVFAMAPSHKAYLSGEDGWQWVGTDG